MSTDRKLPRYKCHKEVYALKIGNIHPVAGSATIAAVITPTDGYYAPFNVDHAYVDKHKPQVGGYWVQYDDGYQSFSPGKAFEDGYTRIKGK